MRLLLDTHAFVWAILSPEKLSPSASRAMKSTSNEVFVSSATAWELATKYRIGKLPQAARLLEDFESLIEDLVASHLPITADHALSAGLLPGAHRDPFDRMLAAQSQLEGLHLITRDPAFGAFDVRVVW